MAEITVGKGKGRWPICIDDDDVGAVYKEYGGGGIHDCWYYVSIIGADVDSIVGDSIKEMRKVVPGELINVRDEILSQLQERLDTAMRTVEMYSRLIESWKRVGD